MLLFKMNAEIAGNYGQISLTLIVSQMLEPIIKNDISDHSQSH